MSDSLRLNARHCEFSLVCWIFFYSYKYFWALFCTMAKFHRNNLILSDFLCFLGRNRINFNLGFIYSTTETKFFCVLCPIPDNLNFSHSGYWKQVLLRFFGWAPLLLPLSLFLVSGSFYTGTLWPYLRGALCGFPVFSAHATLSLPAPVNSSLFVSCRVSLYLLNSRRPLCSAWRIFSEIHTDYSRHKEAAC